jgi:hypothetical protein
VSIGDFLSRDMDRSDRLDPNICITQCQRGAS